MLNRSFNWSNPIQGQIDSMLNEPCTLSRLPAAGRGLAQPHLYKTFQLGLSDGTAEPITATPTVKTIAYCKSQSPHV
jgi:hypothetical protein